MLSLLRSLVEHCDGGGATCVSGDENLTQIPAGWRIRVAHPDSSTVRLSAGRAATFLAEGGMFRAKNVAFALVAIMNGYVRYHDQRFLIEPANPIWQHYESFTWWLLPHGLAGASAILLAPMQFSDRLRRRFTRLHRVVGRVYVVGVFVLAPLGVVIESIDQGLGDPPSFLALSVVN